MKTGLTTEQAVVKLKLSKSPPTAVENYQYLQHLWKHQQMKSLKTFCAGITKKMLLPLWRQCKKKIVFYHEKDIDRLNLGCTLPRLVNICLHKYTDTKFYPFTEADKDLLERNGEYVLCGPSIVLTCKAVVSEILFESRRTFSNQLLGLMPAMNIHIRSVNSCLLVFIRIEISIQRQTDSHLDKRRPVTPKARSCHFFDELDQISKLKHCIQHADRKKMTASVVTVIVLIAILGSRQGAGFTLFVLVKKCGRLSPKKLFNVVVKRESLMNWEEAIYGKNDSVSMKSESVNSGECTSQGKVSKNILTDVKIFLSDIHWQLSDY